MIIIIIIFSIIIIILIVISELPYLLLFFCDHFPPFDVDFLCPNTIHYFYVHLLGRSTFFHLLLVLLFSGTYELGPAYREGPLAWGLWTPLYREAA